ncbi:hypothetical protein WDV06_10655 [Streptomyces racemochromogenes]|uniref:Uncharacterized protein n=1 Tax=Streptomyces racemochromogenes TaxID=67353 RepID=A0ABW7PBX1_9ACTN
MRKMVWRHRDAETPVRRGADGQFYVAAQDVTELLRDLARTFDLPSGADEPAPAGEGQAPSAPLDGETMRAVASILRAQADEMDVQLIAIAGLHPFD